MDVSSMYAEVQNGLSLDVVQLVAPFISGDGLNFDRFTLFPKQDMLYPGSVLTDMSNGDRIIVVHAESVEDFFEDLYIAECQLVTSDPNKTVNPNVKLLTAEYSAKTGYNLPSI